MDSSETIRAMRENLAEIERMINWMEKSNEIHPIDIDVLLKKTRDLYSSLVLLPVGPVKIKTIEKIDPAPEPLPEPEREPVPEPEPAPVPVPEPEPEPVPVPVPVPEIEPEWEPEEEPEWEPYLEPEPIAEQPIRPQQSKQSQQTQQPQQPQRSQYFQQSQPPHQPQPALLSPSLFQRDDSLNEALGKQKPSHDLASSISDIPVADIWSAITINERFLFIRELFGNDPEGFKNTVTLLNSLSTWEAAKKFMSDRFDWDKNNSVANDFLNVVRRRFLK